MQLAVSGDAWFREAEHRGPPVPVKVTVPVGTPAPGGWIDTVPVRVTDWPTTGETGLATTVIDVAAWPTVTDVDEKEPVSFASPLYVAVTESEVTAG